MTSLPGSHDDVGRAAGVREPRQIAAISRSDQDRSVERGAKHACREGADVDERAWPGAQYSPRQR